MLPVLLPVPPLPVLVVCPLPAPVPASAPSPSSFSGGTGYFSIPAAAFSETAPPLILAALVPSLSSTTVASFLTLLTKTAAPIFTLALVSVFLTLNCRRLFSFSMEGASLPVVGVPLPAVVVSSTLKADIIVLALILTDPSGAIVPPVVAVGFVAVMATFFAIVTLASFLLEKTPTLAPRPKAEVFGSLPPLPLPLLPLPLPLVPSTAFLTFWIAPAASWVCVSWVLEVSTEASPITLVGSMDFCPLFCSPAAALLSSVCWVSFNFAVSLDVKSATRGFTVLSTVSFSPVILFSALISTVPAVMLRFMVTSAFVS